MKPFPSGTRRSYYSAVVYCEPAGKYMLAHFLRKLLHSSDRNTGLLRFCLWVKIWLLVNKRSLSEGWPALVLTAALSARGVRDWLPLWWRLNQNTDGPINIPSLIAWKYWTTWWTLNCGTSLYLFFKYNMSKMEITSRYGLHSHCHSLRVVFM